MNGDILTVAEGRYKVLRYGEGFAEVFSLTDGRTDRIYFDGPFGGRLESTITAEVICATTE